MKSHIILISPDKESIETHAVDWDLFLEVWDLLHAHKRKGVSSGLSFEANKKLNTVIEGAKTGEVITAVAASIDANPEKHPASDRVKSLHEATQDALANSTDTEPELEPPQNSDQAFLSSLASLMK